METLHKLLFELASAERISIMQELEKNELKLSHLSKKLELTVTEASRHLQRLCGAGLIEKDTGGKYRVTSYGTLVLHLLSGLSFAVKHRAYSMEYDLSRIPYQFVDRVGELDGGVYIAATLRNLEEGENRIREAQEFIWILSDEVLTSSIPSLVEKLKTPFDLRIILPEGKFPPESESRLPSATGAQKRVLPKVDVLIVLTEKYAVFCLPNRIGKIDYTGFTGEDAKFRNWCRDLFLHYWNKATPFGSTQT